MRTDDLPYLEPWIGTGVYANAFGCEYIFRDGNTPHTHYRRHRMEEIGAVEYPDWRARPVMNMALDSIDALKQSIGGVTRY